MRNTDTVREKVLSNIVCTENLPAPARDLVARAVNKTLTDHKNPHQVGKWLANKLKKKSIAAHDAHCAMLAFAGKVSCLKNCSPETIYHEFYSAFPGMPPVSPEADQGQDTNASNACDSAVSVPEPDVGQDQDQDILARLEADPELFNQDISACVAALADLMSDNLVQYELLRNKISKVTGVSRRSIDKMVKQNASGNDSADDGDPMQAIRERLTHWIADYHVRYIADTKRMYYYLDGVYKNFDEDYIGTLLQLVVGDGINNWHVKEAIGFVKRTAFVSLNQNAFDPRFICVQNGVLDLDNMELSPHDPVRWFVNKLPVKYDPDADCPRIRQFLSEVLRPDDISLIEEVVGWTLWKYDYRPHKAVMLYGSGRNGKGTVLRLVEALHGPDSVAHVSLDQLSNSRFSAVQLVDKAVNLFGDTHAKDMSDTAVFKCATGEDTFLVEEKFKQPFNYKNYAKMIFAANKLPKTPDDSDGFYSRWIIVEFPNQIPPDKMDHALTERLTTPEELSGLLNIALKGLKRLRDNNWTFSYTKTLNDVRKMYRRLSDPVFAFLEDRCMHNPNASVSKAALYKAYQLYASRNGLVVVSQKKFGQLIEENSLIPVDSGWGRDGHRVWRGIDFLLSENVDA